MLNCKLLKTCLLKWKKMVLKCCGSLWGEENGQGLTQTLSPLAWGLRPCKANTVIQGSVLPGWCLSQGTPGLPQHQKLWSCKSNPSHLPISETSIIFAKCNRNNGDYFTLIYFGLWLTNSLPASLNVEVFWCHTLFSCCINPLSLPPSRFGSAFSQKLPCGPSAPAEAALWWH